ncbi:hypothetical protein NEFER03_0483 [Nematocida sp. LUAm3]|nr:hypothetical protein NEFER03_0483 [Nematocida sp. LUAm3]KAI5175940.1 hypothetical protein NEFER02_1800 [Nematocida sp. LUAm2]KAI5178678.1 hypothetical protein NEFER01_1797 [Nematocida sp. LUAm1]
MDSKDRRQENASGEHSRRSYPASGKETGSYPGKRPSPKPRQEYKGTSKHYRARDEERTSEDLQKIIPVKKEKKILELFLDDGELTDSIIQEELKKYNVQVEEPEQELLPQEPDSSLPASDISDRFVAADEEVQEIEELPPMVAALYPGQTEQEVAQEIAKSLSEIRIRPKESPPRRDRNKDESFQRYKEKQREQKKEEEKKKEEDLSKYNIVNGVVHAPKGSDQKVEAWGAAQSSAITSKVFANKKPPISSKFQKTKTTTRAKAPQHSAQHAPVAPSVTPSVTEHVTEHATEHVTEHATEHATEHVAEHVAEVPSVTPTVTEVPSAVEVPAVEVPVTEVPTAVAEAPVAEVPVATLPYIYTKDMLLSCKKNSSKFSVAIDKAIFLKSSSFPRRKREFKQLGFSFSQGKKSSAPQHVFTTIKQHIADFNLILNQVSFGNIDSAAKRILDIKVQSNSDMLELSKMFFDRAMQEEAYAQVYGQLAVLIRKEFRSQEEDPYNEEIYLKEKQDESPIRSNTSVFSRELALLVREEFNTQKEWASVDTVQESIQMSADKLAARVMEISSNKEKEYARIATKKRDMAGIRFVSELFLLGFFTPKVLYNVIGLLMKKSTPENVEKFCYLLKLTGASLNHPLSDHILLGYISWLDIAVESLSPRYRFMVDDIKELQQNDWVPLHGGKPQAQEEDEDEWQCAKKKEKKPQWKKEGRREKHEKHNTLSITEQIERNKESYYKMESILSTIIKDEASIEEEAKRLAKEHNSSVLFFVAITKILIEAYDSAWNNGLVFLKAWKKASPHSLAKKEEVFSYLEDIMEDIIDDSPLAAKNLEVVKDCLQK